MKNIKWQYYQYDSQGEQWVYLHSNISIPQSLKTIVTFVQNFHIIGHRVSGLEWLSINLQSIKHKKGVTDQSDSNPRFQDDVKYRNNVTIWQSTKEKRLSYRSAGF